jgi:uncharacterized membrane protein
VFGLALSVGTISLIARLPSSPVGIVYDVAQFGFSFLILITVWISYTSIMSVLPLEDATTITLNVILLFFVSIEPYLFYLNAVFDLAGQEALLDAASVAYALDMAGLMAILALFTHQLAVEKKGLIPKNLLSKYKRIQISRLIATLLFALTILPIFWSLRVQNTPLRFYLWFVPLIITQTTRATDRTTARAHELDS